MSAYELDFTKPPSGIHSLAAADFPTVVYNASHHSLDITGSSTNHKIVLSNFPAGSVGSSISVESDIELLSDASGLHIVGLALVDPATVSAGYYSGPECSSINSGWRALHRNAWMNADVFYTSLGTASPNYTVGGRHILKLIRTGLHFEFYVDGALMLSFDDTIIREQSLLPAIIVFNCALRVRSFAYSALTIDDVAAIKIAPDITVFSGDRSRESLFCGDFSIRKSAQDSYRAIRLLSGEINSIPSARSYGYVTGSVTRKGSAAVGQVVACFDSGLNLIDTTHSNNDGQFRFDNLPLGSSYSVLALDNDTYTYTPASCDRLTPKEYPWT